MNFFDDLTSRMCCRLDLDLKSFTGTAFRQQIFYRNGVPDRSGLLSPLDMHCWLIIFTLQFQGYIAYPYTYTLNLYLLIGSNVMLIIMCPNIFK